MKSATPLELVPDSLFDGPGEVAALMREKDWSATALGPPERWPQSLRTMVRVLLTSRFSMWMGWGSELSFFYNDAYRPTLGAKHPASLGAPFRELWAEIWPELRPRIEGVLAGGPATWDEGLLLFLERNGYVEETYHTFSYSPLPDDHGGVGGMLSVVIEETDRIIGARRLALLRELATGLNGSKTEEQVFDAVHRCLGGGTKTMPFSLSYLFEDDGRTARLVSRSGFADGDAAAPVLVDCDAGGLWPLSQVRDANEPVLVELPPGTWPCGPWTVPPTRALLLPIAQQAQSRPAGAFVAALTPYRPFDDPYRDFLRLFVGQIAAGLADARAYEEERQRAEALADLDRAKTTFFSNVSHELRTPLTLMLGPVTELLADDAHTGAHEQLQLVHRNGLRLHKLVNTMLEFSRIEAGRVKASYEPTDLAELTADLASVFRSATDKAGLRLVVDCAPLSAPAYVDRDMWEKIVFNLVSNAFKFTMQGEIVVSLRQDGGAARLSVRDTGSGVPAHELPHLFERFHRVEGTRGRTHEGTGIGLALVQELVKLHGGSVAVESEVGRGSTFTVTIPLGCEHVPADRITAPSGATASRNANAYVEEALRWLPDAAPAADAAAAITPAGAARARILVADDNADMRAYLSRLLSQHWSVDAVADGAQALAAARARPPDLVLADVMMPELDGFRLVQELRADARTASIPIILLSARAGEEATAEGLRSGADDYLVKPFSAGALLVRVESALAAARLRAAAYAAAEHERKNLYAMFMEGPAAIAVLRGPEFIVELANPIALDVWGKTTAILGKPLLEALPELRDQEFPAILREVFRSGTAYHAKAALALIDRDGDGELEEIYFDYTYEPIRDDAGRVDGILVFAVDVTQEIVVRRALEVALNQAETANRAKDEFLAVLGHELRNPLAPITTALHLMRLRAGEVAHKERVIIERQVDHLTRLVDDLLDVSRITRGKIELKKQTIELSEVLARAIELSSPLLEQRQHRLELAVPSRGLTVNGDATRLAQIFSNLITNAAKYTESGGELAIFAERRGDEAVVRVRDNGIGISADVLPRVFDLFVQDRQALDRSQGGLGLGLAIVQSLVTMHGGSVTARSEGKGRGSELEVRLPVAAAESSAVSPQAAGAGQRGADGREGSARLRVLIVDDNADAAELLAELLAAAGHETRVAHDGPAALRIAEELRPDVSLLDIGLPVMDGYELARRLRELPQLRAMYLVAVTGYGQESDRARAKASGFDAHLVKPVQVDEMLELLEAHERARRSR